MDIFKQEFKKLRASPILIVFLALCFGFNLIIMSGYNSYPDYVAEASRTAGYKLGAEFDEKVAELEPSEFRDWLAESTTGKTDIFDDYETTYIADAYIKQLGLTGYAADATRTKYEQLQKSVDTKAETDESLTLYFADATEDMHRNLHGNTMKYLLLECALLAALIMLLSVGYEHHNRTSHVVYATKTGRNIMRYKMFASLTAGLAAFVVLNAPTLAFYFLVNDYGGILDSSVSSVFHYFMDYIVGGQRPFVTWQSFTVLTYLLASLGICALLTLCFGLLAFAVGLWVKNSYIGFFVFIIINAGCVVLALVILGLLQNFLMLSPVWLWLKQGYWFSDGGPDILWKNFETFGALASLLILAVLCAVSAVTFRKRNIA